MTINLQAFIDDSATAGGEFVLAGHIASAESWAQFSREWEQLLPLATRGKSGKYRFKMKEMVRPPERFERVQLFYKVIEDHVISSISCRMNVGDFEQAKGRASRLAQIYGWSVNLGDWDSPYFVVFRGLMDGFHDRRKDFKSGIPVDQKVDFIFDEEKKSKAILAAWDEYLDMRDDDVRPYYGAHPRFEDDEEFLPLQAADLWAWWASEWYEEDASHFPDKMRDYDFGKWRGKQRRNIAISMDEDAIFDTLQRLIFIHAPFKE